MEGAIHSPPPGTDFCYEQLHLYFNLSNLTANNSTKKGIAMQLLKSAAV